MRVDWYGYEHMAGQVGSGGLGEYEYGRGREGQGLTGKPGAPVVA